MRLDSTLQFIVIVSSGYIFRLSLIFFVLTGNKMKLLIWSVFRSLVISQLGQKSRDKKFYFYRVV